MDPQFKDKDDVAHTVERLKQKYLQRTKQLPPSEDIASGTSDGAVHRLILANRSKQPRKELKGYSKALHELFKAVSNHPDQFGCDRGLHGSNEDLSGDSTAAALQDSQVLLTETDVTLSSCLDGSPGSQETETDGELRRAHQLPDSCRSSSLVLAKVYQEMMTIYEQLKAERQSQQQWERELQERERRLKQQEEAVGRQAGLEEMLHTRILAVEEKHQEEVSQLQGLVQEKSKENRRLKSSFDTIKELNDNMKKQLNEVSEQNKKLESQSKRVQARLENLQRKYELSVASRGLQKVSLKSTECVKPSKMEKTSASGKPSNKGSSSPSPPKLLALLLDWVLDGQTFSSVAGSEGKSVGQCLPPEVVLNERCLKVLPLLADQLRHTPSSEPDLLLNVLRLIHWALRHMDSNTQVQWLVLSPHSKRVPDSNPGMGDLLCVELACSSRVSMGFLQHVALSATLRRIGEEVSKPPGQLMVPQSEDPDLPKSCSGAGGGPCRSWPLYCSPCPHTRILSALIILRTVTQADVLAQALDSLHTELMSEESRGLFVHSGGVCVLLWMLWAGRGGLRTPVDILMQLTEQSRYLNPFLEACSCEEFFRTVSQLLKNPRLELPSLEKLSILLQKLSTIRKNRRLFELSSLHLQIQELYHKANHTHTFLCLNLRSILHNLR
ncbi:coiled-coil domain-containing protein 138-like isoform X1 [Epinephelus moara]|uniref:coiled-coil domain-containing protein 138-like isoform X1 n=1 Tax=Epinephelus moara TaxID=300413 RepID=UPI00214E3CF5|nr:coiled-coil domain-containing protein 138-like isoform X1 [Epinephelus moara]